jgi:hypothetical protein
MQDFGAVAHVELAPKRRDQPKMPNCENLTKIQRRQSIWRLGNFFAH